MDAVPQIVLNIVIAGGIYSLAALGFNVLYSTTRFFDLGYGAYALVGGYAVLCLYKWVGINLELSLLLGVLIAGLTGFLTEKIVYRALRARRASNTVLLIASLGVFTLGQAALAIFFSSQFQSLSRDIASQRLFSIESGVITATQLLILTAAFAVMGILVVVWRYTKFGRAVRAIADDEEVAQTVGIDSERVIGAVYFIGAAVGGIAGIAVGFDMGLQPLGMTILLEAVIAAVVGGIGNMYGSVLGGFLLALVENIGAWQFGGEWKFAFAFAVLILFLLYRPQGILPK
ncbi:branched-chain amino acid ABC transporter permease [Candidatus Kaiserbacteria bacterium]|nr:branched-chain amino acid ABC transporter permease [Candidatus Kaiserbacteria bacterium]